MDLARQIISTDQTIRSETVQDLKDCKSQSLSTQAKKDEQLVSMTPAIKKGFCSIRWWHSIITHRKWN